MNKKELKQLIEDVLSQYYKVTSYNGGITISNKIRTLHFEFYIDESIICFNNSDTGTVVEFIAHNKDELLLNLIKLKGEIANE